MEKSIVKYRFTVIVLFLDILNNGPFPASPIVVDDLWNGHIYSIKIVTRNKNSISEHLNLTATLGLFKQFKSL